MDFAIDYSHRSPNYWSAETYLNLTGHQRVPRFLTIHKSEGGLDDGIAWLCNPASEVSAHYVVSRDGKIFNLVDVKDVAWHCGEQYKANKKDGPYRTLWGWGNENADSIGVELVGLPDEPVTEVQYQALVYIIKLHNIVTDNLHIIQHKEITVRKQDCQLFDVGHFWGMVNNASASQYFPQTGHAVNQPFLDEWNLNGLGVCGYPLSDEYTESVPGIGTIRYQDFENVILQILPGQNEARVCAGIRRYKYGK